MAADDCTAREALCAAIQSQELAHRLPGMQGLEPTLIAQARTALAAIAADCRAIGTQVVDALAQSGIAAKLDETGLVADPPQYQFVSIDVPVRDPTAAIRCALALGFSAPIGLDTTAWQVMRRTHDEVCLKRFDDLTTRVLLRWRKSAMGYRGLRALRPSLTDLEHLDFRGGSWLLGLVAGMVRRGRRKLGLHESGNIGEWLGTPSCLLPPLFALAEVGPADRVLDIGCGDGRIVIEAARRYGCQGIGLELERGLCDVARRAAEEAQVDSLVEFRNADARVVGFPEASVVFLFLPVAQLGELVRRLLTAMPRGTRIVAHEQSPLTDTPPPTCAEPMFAERAITIGYLWVVA